MSDTREDRLPPNQVLTRKWPVLHVGSIPLFVPELWSFRVSGLVERELHLDWPAFQVLPMTDVRADMHCVTRWSRYDNDWRGVSAREIIRQAGVLPEARFVNLLCDGGYTTSVPIDVFSADDVLLATTHSGQPLTPEHGYPLRAVIPDRYAWKSAKWLREIRFEAEDHLGFWELRGYHNNADPWREERFADEPIRRGQVVRRGQVIDGR
ncbi:MAG TPA: sulfite oxidase-like oxidoreductase [Thermomicrobiales bacterium]|jgi:DMSO/TMAO reductase YedYZ molybdopterin-dependent catalytic subunit|nr:sulfite oxidase-like oxidoreductase [Thermomicrobiales bacterium]